MSKNDVSVGRAAEGLKELAASFAGENPSLSGEIDLLVSSMETLSGAPPTPSTADFDIAGEEVSFPDEERSAAGILERIIDENDLLPASFLEQGALTQRAVARIMLKKAHRGLPPGSGWGTGFLVSPDLLITNNHVIPDLSMAGKVRAQFNYQVGPDGLDKASEVYETAGFDVFHTNVALDYTLIRIQEKQFSHDPEMGTGLFPPGHRWGFISLDDSPGYRKGQHCNIIQHPSGRKKEIALQKNEINKLFQNVVRYHADTEPGSSGSPVLDNLWQLIALHHAGGERDHNGKWLDNEGIRIDRLVGDLRKAFSGRQNILGELGIIQ